jgi:hypothetical protein
MRRNPDSIYATLCILFLGASAAWGQPREVCCPKYDKASETTVEGVVEEVETRFGQAASAGIHLIVRAGEDLYDVHLGPKSYVRKQNLAFAEGDTITMVCAPVIGAERDSPDAPLEVVARQITRGDATVVLRDADGRPRWRHKTT